MRMSSAQGAAMRAMGGLLLKTSLCRGCAHFGAVRAWGRLLSVWRGHVLCKAMGVSGGCACCSDLRTQSLSRAQLQPRRSALPRFILPGARHQRPLLSRIAG